MRKSLLAQYAIATTDPKLGGDMLIVRTSRRKLARLRGRISIIKSDETACPWPLSELAIHRARQTDGLQLLIDIRSCADRQGSSAAGPRGAALQLSSVVYRRGSNGHVGVCVHACLLLLPTASICGRAGGCVQTLTPHTYT